MSIAPEAFRFQVVNAARLWPTHDLSRIKIQRYLNAHTYVDFEDERRGGYAVYECTTKGAKKLRIFVPSRYANVLRMLNAKIRFYQDVYTEEQQNYSGFNEKEQKNLDSLIDGTARNLIFHCKVRQEFFSDIEAEFYGGRSALARSPSKRINFDWRSAIMDSWLIVEHFVGGDQLPRSYIELSRQGEVEWDKDPLSLTLKGTGHSINTRSLLTSCVAQNGGRRMQYLLIVRKGVGTEVSVPDGT